MAKSSSRIDTETDDDGSTSLARSISLEGGPSLWKSAKRQARLKILHAISKIYKSPSSSIERSDYGPQPLVTVGPVIGKVTTTSSRILVEVNRTRVLTLVVNKIEFEKPLSFLQRQITPGKQLPPNLSTTGAKTQPSQQGRPHMKKLQKEVKANRPSVFEFRDLEPDTRYSVEIKGCRGLVTGSFRTFPAVPAQNMTVGVISCNKIFITEQAIPMHSDLWAHLAKSVEAGNIDLLVHLGDQIYGDGDKRQDAEAGADEDKWSDRFRVGQSLLKKLPQDEWVQRRDAICEKYREVYRATWRHPPTATCLANCPNLMIYDDHEVRDNWGDLTSDWDKQSRDFFVAQCAWLVSMEYQRQLYEDVDFSKFEDIDKVLYRLQLSCIRGNLTVHNL
jgi:hypothetical protein